MSIPKNPTVSHGKTMPRKMGTCSGLEGGQRRKPIHKVTEAPIYAEQRTPVVAFVARKRAFQRLNRLKRVATVLIPGELPLRRWYTLTRWLKAYMKIMTGELNMSTWYAVSSLSI